ncbi:MAG TPA: IS481 family transposase [Casimicrobiaceae bacterium]|nr:IS481 family transposase [Casimicrobiaceae bacterium]
MDIGRYLVEAHLREGRSVGELASQHGIHRSWLYRLLERYRAEGEAGLAPRSRRAHSQPRAVAENVVEQIVALRNELTRDGLDAGALTIHWHLVERTGSAPSVSSIWRILRRRGLITPQPRKRPHSATTRFAAELPNECWQSDMTHWALADGRDVEIVNLIDDHSRLCLASVALAVTTAVDVGRIFQDARLRYGAPAALLTDNGCIYTATHRGGKVVLQTELERLGIRHKHARPYHPQTCGKVERFHQTMKRYLAKQTPAPSLALLQAQLDAFVQRYNDRRPHRALGRATPRSVYETKVKAAPAARVKTHFRVRYDTVDRHGKVTLRYASKLLHIGMGARFKGQKVVLLVADRDVRVLDREGLLLRQLTLDPNRNYQRQSA